MSVLFCYRHVAVQPIQQRDPCLPPVDRPTRELVSDCPCNRQCCMNFKKVETRDRARTLKIGEMAPKRKARAVLKKTEKVVEETVQVEIIDDGDKAAEIAMEVGKDLGDELTRTTVIIGGTEETGEGQEKRVEIPIESQTFEEPVVVTPRKEAEKKGPEDRGEREKEWADAVEEQREVETEEPETEKEDETGEPEAEETDKTEEDAEGLVKTPEKGEGGTTRKRDGGVGGGETESRKRRRRRRRGQGIGGREPQQYKRYVYRVLKQLHPELGISSAAMEVLNTYMNDMFERLADEAAKLSRYTERKTLSSREVQSAVRLVLPRELGRHAIAEGAKAVTNYMSYGE